MIATIFAAILIAVSIAALVYLSAMNFGRVWLFSPAILMTAYVALIVLPGVLLIDDRPGASAALIAHAMWFAGATAGVFAATRITPSASPFEAPWPSDIPGRRIIFILFVALGIAAVVFTFFMFGRVPLLNGLEAMLGFDPSVSMNDARRMNTLEHARGKTFYFGQGYLRQIYTVVAPVFCVALFLKEKIETGRAPIYVIAIMAIFVLAAAMNGQIWLPALTILQFVIAWFLADAVSALHPRPGRLIVKALAIYVVLIGFVFAYRYLQALGGRHFDSFFWDTLHRTYFYGMAPLFDIFPKEQPFRWGSTWASDLLGMLPGSSKSFSYEANTLVYGTEGFTLSAGIVASSYVNFGYVGVLLTAAVVTAIFTTAYLRLVHSGKALNMAVGLYLSIAFMTALIGDLVTYVVALATAALIIIAYEVARRVIPQK